MDHRLETRLLGLPHDKLARIAAAAIATSSAAIAAVDAALAEEMPLASWAVADVLLSPDLLTLIFTNMGLDEHASAAVCSRWLTAWRAMLQTKRYLRPADSAALELPAEGNLLVSHSGEFASFLVAHSSLRLRRYEIGVWHRPTRSRQLLQFEPSVHPYCLHLTDEKMWIVLHDAGVTGYPSRLCCLRLSDFETLAEIQVSDLRDASGAVPQFPDGSLEDIEYISQHSALSPDGCTLWLCAGFYEREPFGEYIFAIDAESLQWKLCLESEDSNYGLMAMGDELFVLLEKDGYGINVYSADSGQLLRTIDTRMAGCYVQMCGSNGRLYLVRRDWLRPEKNTATGEVYMLDAETGDVLQRLRMKLVLDHHRCEWTVGRVFIVRNFLCVSIHPCALRDPFGGLLCDEVAIAALL
jgi:hypothetical protein